MGNELPFSILVLNSKVPRSDLQQILQSRDEIYGGFLILVQWFFGKTPRGVGFFFLLGWPQTNYSYPKISLYLKFQKCDTHSTKKTGLFGLTYPSSAIFFRWTDNTNGTHESHSKIPYPQIRQKMITFLFTLYLNLIFSLQAISRILLSFLDFLNPKLEKSDILAILATLAYKYTYQQGLTMI